MVCVATPPLFHHAETIKALRSGRNVLCEKPFAMNMQEAREMVEVARDCGLHVACCSSRFIGWDLNLKVRKLINSGAIGDIFLLDWIHRKQCSRSGIEHLSNSRWFLDKSKNGGGILMDWGPYDMAVLVSVFQPQVVRVSNAFCRQADVPANLPEGVVYDIETQVGASLAFEQADGKTLTIRYERTNATHGEPLEAQMLYGTKGSLSWNWLPFGENLAITRRRTLSTDRLDVEQTPASSTADPGAWVHAPVREFDKFLRGEATDWVLVNEKALEPFSIIRAIYDSAGTGKSVTLNFTE
jgi:predicted dehydrogenase